MKRLIAFALCLGLSACNLEMHIGKIINISSICYDNTSRAYKCITVKDSKDDTIHVFEKYEPRADSYKVGDSVYYNSTGIYD